MKVLTVFTAFCATALAAPSGAQAFDILALRSASPIHLAPLSASRGFFFLNLPQQGAQCNGENNQATFYLQDSKLFLYSDGDAAQQVYVDRFGTGKVGYITAGSTPPVSSELEGWSIDGEGILLFRNETLQACPDSVDGPWSVWDAQAFEPNGNRGCLGFLPRSVPNANPVSCVYS